MGVWHSYRLRLARRRWRFRALRKSKELRPVSDNTATIGSKDVLVFSTFRNEHIRLPYFLKYYRDLGVKHFLMVDNNSDDGGREYLAQQPDVSLWTTPHSYLDARFGVDWLNHLQSKYGVDHWNLVVDPDEFFVYPYCDTRPLPALTDWLDSCAIRSFGAMLIDMYPKGPVGETDYAPGQDPLEVSNWFDSGNYSIKRNWTNWNLWIQGGPRARVFFADQPEKAPALNKVPLVKWQRRYAYSSSTHMVLPRGLNLVFDEDGGEKACGALLHTKFLNTFGDKALEELERGQHYDASAEYKAYAEGDASPDMWCKWSEKYINWRQLEILGLISKGNWA